MKPASCVYLASWCCILSQRYALYSSHQSSGLSFNKSLLCRKDYSARSKNVVAVGNSFWFWCCLQLIFKFCGRWNLHHIHCSSDVSLWLIDLLYSCLSLSLMTHATLTRAFLWSAADTQFFLISSLARTPNIKHLFSINSTNYFDKRSLHGLYIVPSLE